MPDGDANAERMQMALRRFELPLLQFATRITGDRERARDVVQETFVKFQNNGAFQNPSPQPGSSPSVVTGRSMFVERKGGRNISTRS